jgi:hypothetical protein
VAKPIDYNVGLDALAKLRDQQSRLAIAKAYIRSPSRGCDANL